jgi:hypothetical protein
VAQPNSRCTFCLSRRAPGDCKMRAMCWMKAYAIIDFSPAQELTTFEQ